MGGGMFVVWYDTLMKSWRHDNPSLSKHSRYPTWRLYPISANWHEFYKVYEHTKFWWMLAGQFLSCQLAYSFVNTEAKSDPSPALVCDECECDTWPDSSQRAQTPLKTSGVCGVHHQNFMVGTTKSIHGSVWALRLTWLWFCLFVLYSYC